MTFGELKSFVAVKLRGDNNSFEITPLLLKEAITEVCRYCTPSKLIALLPTPIQQVTEAEAEETLPPSIPADGFRLVNRYKYLKTPNIPDNIDSSFVLPIDEELCIAVAYFLMSYASFKNRDYYEAKAKSFCTLYDNNSVSHSSQY